MKHVLMTAALAWAGATLLLTAQGSAPRTTQPAAGQGSARPVSQAAPAPAPARAQASAVADAARHRDWLNKYCVNCHGNRTALPANEPLNLESASLDNLLPHAATWERVLRKLSVRAMPPQGLPHPPEAEYASFTSWLAGSLDRAWSGRSTPGVYVVHRLNRTEYANAIRDLLGLEINVAELLPSDGGDFGFDNIAAALGTSPRTRRRGSACCAS